MKKNDLIILGAAGIAVYFILRTGGVFNSTGLSYAAPAGYGDTSRYDAYAPIAKQNGGWGIE